MCMFVALDDEISLYEIFSKKNVKYYAIYELTITQQIGYRHLILIDQ